MHKVSTLFQPCFVKSLCNCTDPCLPVHVQLIVQIAVFMAIVWPQTPVSVSQAGEDPTVPVVSPPAVAVCEAVLFV